MGEIADLVIEGDMCQYCGVIMDGDGYPQTCDECLKDGIDDKNEDNNDSLKKNKKG